MRVCVSRLTYFKLVTETHGWLGEIASGPPYAAFWTVNPRASHACSLLGLSSNPVNVNMLYSTDSYSVCTVVGAQAHGKHADDVSLVFLIYAGYSRKQPKTLWYSLY